MNDNFDFDAPDPYGRSYYYDFDGTPCTYARYQDCVREKLRARLKHPWSDPVEDPSRIAITRFVMAEEEVTISTVWTGNNENLGPGTPLIFETMIFGGPHDEERWLYATRAEALVGHDHVVAFVRDDVAIPTTDDPKGGGNFPSEDERGSAV